MEEKEKRAEELDAKLLKLKLTNTTTKVDQSDIDEKVVEFVRYAGAWKERKGACMDAISKIWQDSNDKPEAILKNKVGGETDDDAEVDWSKWSELYKICKTKKAKLKEDAKKAKKSGNKKKK